MHGFIAIQHRGYVCIGIYGYKLKKLALKRGESQSASNKFKTMDFTKQKHQKAFYELNFNFSALCGCGSIQNLNGD